jgi:hypothetical protein
MQERRGSDLTPLTGHHRAGLIGTSADPAAPMTFMRSRVSRRGSRDGTIAALHSGCVVRRALRSEHDRLRNRVTTDYARLCRPSRTSPRVPSAPIGDVSRRRCPPARGCAGQCPPAARVVVPEQGRWPCPAGRSLPRSGASLRRRDCPAAARRCGHRGSPRSPSAGCPAAHMAEEPPAKAGNRRLAAARTCGPQLSSRPGDRRVPDGGLAWPRDAPTHEVLL